MHSTHSLHGAGAWDDLDPRGFCSVTYLLSLVLTSLPNSSTKYESKGDESIG